MVVAVTSVSQALLRTLCILRLTTSSQAIKQIHFLQLHCLLSPLRQLLLLLLLLLRRRQQWQSPAAAARRPLLTCSCPSHHPLLLPPALLLLLLLLLSFSKNITLLQMHWGALAGCCLHLHTHPHLLLCLQRHWRALPRRRRQHRGRMHMALCAARQLVVALLRQLLQLLLLRHVLLLLLRLQLIAGMLILLLHMRQAWRLRNRWAVWCQQRLHTLLGNEEGSSRVIGHHGQLAPGWGMLHVGCFLR